MACLTKGNPGTASSDVCRERCERGGARAGARRRSGLLALRAEMMRMPAWSSRLPGTTNGTGSVALSPGNTHRSSAAEWTGFSMHGGWSSAKTLSAFSKVTSNSRAFRPLRRDPPPGGARAHSPRTHNVWASSMLGCGPPSGDERPTAPIASLGGVPWGRVRYRRLARPGDPPRTGP